MTEPEKLMRGLFAHAVAAARPEGKIKPLPSRRVKGETVVLGAGKAAASMAAAFEDAWGLPVQGLVVTRYGHKLPTKHVEVVEAAHPLPDAAGLRAAAKIFWLAEHATADDLVVFLGSGGASALLTLPADGITLEDKRKVGEALLRSGATISEMNAVRSAMSKIKGGRLAAACAPAKLVTYLISDVPGDDPAVIGSGPTVQRPADAPGGLEVLDKYGIDVPQHVLDAIKASVPPLLPRGYSEPVVIAKARQVLDAAAEHVSAQGWRPVLLGDAVEGEARVVGADMARMARHLAENGSQPTVLLSGGETTVTVRGAGDGGRNQEFLLALALELDGIDGVHAIACDTDGLDGTTNAAGAVAAPDTLARMRAAGLDPQECLDGNDAYRAFAAVDALVATGPTLTNVNDFRAVFIVPRR